MKELRHTKNILSPKQLGNLIVLSKDVGKYIKGQYSPGLNVKQSRQVRDSSEFVLDTLGIAIAPLHEDYAVLDSEDVVPISATDGLEDNILSGPFYVIINPVRRALDGLLHNEFVMAYVMSSESAVNSIPDKLFEFKDYDGRLTVRGNYPSDAGDTVGGARLRYSSMAAELVEKPGAMMLSNLHGRLMTENRVIMPQTGR